MFPDHYDDLSICDLKEHFKNIRKVMREKRAEGTAVIGKKHGTGTGADEYEASLEDIRELELHVNVPKWWAAPSFLLPHLNVRKSKESIGNVSFLM